MDLYISAIDPSDADQARPVVDFLDAQPGTHPFQYPGWVAASAELGSDIQLLVGHGGSAVRFVAAANRFPLLRRPPVRAIECRYGPVAVDEDALAVGLRRLAGWWSDRPTHLDVHPNISVEAGERIAAQLSKERWRVAPVAGSASSLVVELSSDEQLLGSFRKTTRHEIVRAKKLGVSVRAGTDAPSFDELHREMATRKGIPPQAPGLFPAVARWLEREPDRGSILIACGPAGEVIGGVVILRAGGCVWYTWGATRRLEGANAGHVLQFEAMRWAREVGCARYDLGGYEPGGPVATFKAGFSTNLVRSAPGLRLTRKGPGWLANEAARRLRRGDVT